MAPHPLPSRGLTGTGLTCTRNGSRAEYDKKKYVWKLLYIYMLGYPVEFGHKQASDLIAAPKCVPGATQSMHASQSALQLSCQAPPALTFRDAATNFATAASFMIVRMAATSLTAASDLAPIMHAGMQRSRSATWHAPSCSTRCACPVRTGLSLLQPCCVLCSALEQLSTIRH